MACTSKGQKRPSSILSFAAFDLYRLSRLSKRNLNKFCLRLRPKATYALFLLPAKSLITDRRQPPPGLHDHRCQQVPTHLLRPSKRTSSISGRKLRKHPSLSGNDTAFTLKASYDRQGAIKTFLANLPTSVLKLCDPKRLSCEAASERCDLSSRYSASDTSMVLPASRSVHNIEGPWNKNTSLNVTAVARALTGTTSLKQRLFCLRSNAPAACPTYLASSPYLLAAFGMSFSFSQFFFISLSTFYLQAFVKIVRIYDTFPDG